MPGAGKSSGILSLLKKNFVYGVSSLLEKTAVFLLLPLYTNFLSPADYGIYSILFTFLTLVSFVSSLGIETGLSKYLIEYDKKAYLSTGFWGGFGLSALLTLLLFIFSKPLNYALFLTDKYEGIYNLSLLIILFDSASRTFINLILAEQTSKRYFYLSFFRGTLNIGLNIYFLAFLNRGLSGVIEASAISSFLVAIYCSALSARHINFIFDGHIFKKLIGFGFPLMLTSAFITLLNFSDRFLIQYFHGAGEAGKYSAAYRIAMVMNTAVTAFSMGALPFITAALKEKSGERAVFGKILLLMSAVMAAVFLAVEYFLDPFIKIEILGRHIINPAYYDALNIIPLILLSYIFYGFSQNFNLNIYHKEKTKIILWITSISFFINLILNAALIPNYGSMGAAYSNLISFAVMAVMTYYYAAKVFPVKNDWAGAAIIMGTGGLFYFIFAVILKDFILVKVFAFVFYMAVMAVYLRKKEVI